MADFDPETGEVIETVYRRSRELAELFAALSEFQGELENVGRDAENPGFKRDNKTSRYATLGAVLDEIRPKLKAHGLSLIQMPINGDGDTVGVSTLLGHKSGQWIEATLYVRPTQTTAPAVGSVITYVRRYAAMAITGLAPDDDDGTAGAQITSGSRAPIKEDQRYAPTQNNGPYISEEQRAEISALAESLGSDIPKFCKYMSVVEIADIRLADYGKALTALRADAAFRADKARKMQPAEMG